MAKKNEGQSQKATQRAAPLTSELVERLTQDILNEGKPTKSSTLQRPLPSIPTTAENPVPREHLPEVQAHLNAMCIVDERRNALLAYQADFGYNEAAARADNFDPDDILDRRDSELLQVYFVLSEYKTANDMLSRETEGLKAMINNLKDMVKFLRPDFVIGSDPYAPTEWLYGYLVELEIEIEEARSKPALQAIRQSHLDKIEKELAEAKSRLAQQAIDFASQERRNAQIKNKPSDVPALQSKIVVLEEDKKLTAILTKNHIERLEQENQALKNENQMLRQSQEECGVLKAKQAAEEANKKVVELEKLLKSRDDEIATLKTEVKTKDKSLEHYAVIGKSLGEVRARALNKSRSYKTSSKVTQIGNNAAHEGDIKVELALYQTGHLKEKFWFDNAYSVKLDSILEDPEAIESINSSERLRTVYNFGASLHEAICYNQKDGTTNARHNEIMDLRKHCLRQWDYHWQNVTTVSEVVKPFDTDVDVHRNMIRITVIFEELRKLKIAEVQRQQS